MKKYLAFLFFFCLQIITAQVKVDIASKARVESKIVEIRYVATTIPIFKTGIKNGYYIERCDFENLVDTNRLKTLVYKPLNTNAILPIPETDSAWQKLAKQNKTYAMVYSALYKLPVGEDAKTKEAAKMMYSLVMKNLDFNPNASKAAGLYFKDSTITNQKYVAYKIAIKEKGKVLYVGYFWLNPNINSSLPNVPFKKIFAGNKTLNLLFEARNGIVDYGSYAAERSTDSINFTVINKQPIVFGYSDYDKTKTDISYVDTVPLNAKKYFYRIRGVSYFGEMGPPSNVLSASGITPLDAVPRIDSSQLLNNATHIKLFFKMPEGFDYNKIQGFGISRCKKSNTDLVFITKKLLPKNTRTYIDTTAVETNYYRVFAYGTEGDTVGSFEYFAMLPDRTPPAVPSNFTGSIDSLGKITLSWNANTEADFKGYRIFKKNAAFEDWVEITKTFLEKTTFRDSVDLNTLTKNVLYTITSVDKRYNNSAYAPTLTLKRPDKIAPEAALINEVGNTGKAISLAFTHSYSSDVSKYVLSRKIHNELTYTFLKLWSITDSLTNFIDTTCVEDKIYNYQLLTFDDSNNKAENISVPIQFKPRVKKKITDIKITALANNSAELKWSYSEKSVFSFVIYKSKKEEPAKILTTLKANENNLIDFDLKVGTTYLYQIKAIFKNGIESELSDIITLKF